MKTKRHLKREARKLCKGHPSEVVKRLINSNPQAYIDGHQRAERRANEAAAQAERERIEAYRMRERSFVIPLVTTGLLALTENLNREDDLEEK